MTRGGEDRRQAGVAALDGGRSQVVTLRDAEEWVVMRGRPGLEYGLTLVALSPTVSDRCGGGRSWFLSV